MKKEEQERSESGAPIYRYGEPNGDFEPAIGIEENIEIISEHIEKHIGSIDFVLHEIESDIVHIDVHIVTPYEEDEIKILITSGMSDRPMSNPEGLEGYNYAELMIFLPKDWPLTEEAIQDDENYWPIGELKYLARFPHIHKTWIWETHTIPNGDPPEPFSTNTKFCCSLLLPPITLKEESWELEIDENKKIYFFAIVPIYEEEMNFKLKQGIEALLEKFDEFNINEIIDIHRKNVCK